METCPSQENIYPCRCEADQFGRIKVTCSRNLNSLETFQQALKSLTGKNKVDLRLEDFNMGIPPNFFAGISIKTLEFYSCSVDSLTKDDQPGLLGLENDLEVRYLFRFVF